MFYDFLSFPRSPSTGWNNGYERTGVPIQGSALRAVGRLAKMSGSMRETIRSDPGANSDSDTPETGHPRGTLAIVAIYGLLLVLGWLAMYFLRFLVRGGPTA